MKRLFRHAYHGGEIKGSSAKRSLQQSTGEGRHLSGVFKVNWVSIKEDILAILNRMYLDGKIMDPQKHGILVCIPKTDSPSTPADYRSITLLNTDYKILAHIVATRQRSTLPEVLHQSHHCGFPGNTIFDAVATVRDAIAYVELTHAPLCILSLDFRAAFDRISHTYLFRMLHRYGYSERFIAIINSMYDKRCPRYK
jgi:hypothetical protein